MGKILLKLYFAGHNERSEKILANLERLLREELRNQYELTVIDVIKNPQLAESENILATPTLLKSFPPPIRRVIGDLFDKEKIFWGLEIIKK